MYRRAPNERLDDLRYALRVLDEEMHLGLEHQAADRIRQILLQQIARIEGAIGPAATVVVVPNIDE